VDGKRKTLVHLLIWVLILFGLYVAKSYSYLLFHSLAEFFSIIVAAGIFIVAWNSRRFLDNNYLLFLGIAYGFVASIDLVHTLAYKGMGVFRGYDANLSTQLWILARYMQSISLLLAPFFLRRKLKFGVVFITYFLITSFSFLSVFYWNIFPIAYVEGSGLTPFKIISEYIISAILVASIVLLLKNNSAFDKYVLRLLVWSIIITILAELSFTLYLSVYGFFNLIGHYFKIISFFLIYKAIIETGLAKPYSLLFRELKQSEESLKRARDSLEIRVQERTGELARANEELQFEIAERKQAQASLEQFRRQNELILNSAGEGILGLDLQGNQTFVNPAAAKMLGYRVDELIGKPSHMTWHRFRPDRTPYPKEACSIHQSSADAAAHTKSGEDVFWRKDETNFPVEYTCTPIFEEGEHVGTVIVFQDVSARKKLLAQFLQAQKMEAVGRLAGGIAHDFNNLLTAILGYAEIAMSSLPADSTVLRDIQDMHQAASRAAALTRQLLAFSRRQIVEPKIINLNDLICDIHTMLRRIIGEDVELTTKPAPDLSSVMVDPSQIEQVILNLAVNARDAMPKGGKLLIETANVSFDESHTQRRPEMKIGEYAMLAVSDTGIGISDEVKSHIFEPFFTTKETGKGTGLGLATVYGIVKQSGGFIYVYSEPNRGTSFKIYFPAVKEPASALPQRDESREMPFGTETVLVVEDELAVRELAARVLSQQGYTVLDAANGEEALAKAHQHADRAIHLLFTDVVLPGMNGKELADKLKELFPGIKVLFTSGYTDEAIVNHHALEPSYSLLQKPFSPASLARRVRRILDES
jgi:PAS domain S-box-containing protein